MCAYVYICCYKISTQHAPPNPNTTRTNTSRHEHANTASINTLSAGSMPNTGNTDTANTGNWTPENRNIQIGLSQVNAAQSTMHNTPMIMHTYIYIYIHVCIHTQPTNGWANSGRIWPNTANMGANTDNTTRSTRKPVQHDTTRKVATQHAGGQHDRDRHGPPLIYV